MPKALPLLLVAVVLAAAALPPGGVQRPSGAGRGLVLDLSLGALVSLHIGLGA